MKNDPIVGGREGDQEKNMSNHEERFKARSHVIKEAASPFSGSDALGYIRS
ncbi:hypothetical protein MTR_1g073540 [Medicago truncatula]|uniref:Uncharacterized protein n=1 Tax=Medicago truncatula TaxID=3880 RepID=A0A072VLF4_MEDTR|nr:hypothetical protein MTR_1g073540 [Medicago truncatula]